MIDVEFSKFDPQENQWIYFFFDEEKDSLKDIEKLLKDLATIVNEGKYNIFKEVSELRQKKIAGKFEKTIEIKPSFMGIGIDIKEEGKLIARLIQEK